MTALQQFSLRLDLDCPTVGDPLVLIDDLTNGLSQLHSVGFYVVVKGDSTRIRQHLYDREQQRHEKSYRYGQVYDLMDSLTSPAVHHCFTLPFQYTQILRFGPRFPEARFQYVHFLLVTNDVLFELEFFERVARCFPALEFLHVSDGLRESALDLDCHWTVQHDRAIEFRHLLSLHLFGATKQCIELFLNENITRLPRLTRLMIDYEDLEIVTYNFKRPETRRKCAQMTNLFTLRDIVGSKDFHDYFPLLYAPSVDDDGGEKISTALP